jgi:PBP1b-binding outer membrane lipoprotein LpoB
MMKNRTFFILVWAASSVSVGCGGNQVVRGSQEPGVDSAALSTGLDKDDIQRMLSDNLNNLRAAPLMNDWRVANPKPKVAVFPFQNKTTEHVDSQLDTILSEAETWLIDSQVVDVISRERQGEMLNEVKTQHTDAFDPSTVARYGKQMGIKYALTGKVQANDERSEDMRRVQYFFYMQVIDVETSAIKWQHKAYVTKAIK